MLPASVVALVGATACAGPHATGAGVRPDEMTAEAHRDAASHQEEIARQGPYLRRSGWAPWTYSWDPATEHLAERDAHLAAAETLEVRYREACADLPVITESTSPLTRHGLSAAPIDAGVAFMLAPAAGPPEEVLAAIRCHRAWLVLEDRPTASEDVVALDGLRYSVQIRDEVLELRVTTTVAGAVSELRRRAEAAIARSQAGKAAR